MDVDERERNIMVDVVAAAVEHRHRRRRRRVVILFDDFIFILLAYRLLCWAIRYQQKMPTVSLIQLQGAGREDSRVRFVEVSVLKFCDHEI